jgi:hypothetical protein
VLLPTRQAPLDILLITGTAEYPMSGSPFTIDRLLDAQGLECHFGTLDHKNRKDACQPRTTPTQSKTHSLRFLAYKSTKLNWICIKCSVSSSILTKYPVNVHQCVLYICLIGGKKWPSGTIHEKDYAWLDLALYASLYIVPAQNSCMQ